MSPTVLRIGPYRFFFNSREETRRHVHVAASDGVAKFWLDPVIALASYYHLNEQELRRLDELVRQYEHTFRAAWDEHFRS
jgi:hypothetical protein